MKNVGSADKIARGIVAIAAVVLALVVGGGWSIVFWAVAAIMVVTAVMGTCPIYKVVGISTRPKAGA